MADQRPPALGFIFITLLLDVIGLGLIIPGVPRLIQELTGEGLMQDLRDVGLPAQQRFIDADLLPLAALANYTPA